MEINLMKPTPDWYFGIFAAVAYLLPIGAYVLRKQLDELRGWLGIGAIFFRIGAAASIPAAVLVAFGFLLELAIDLPRFFMRVVHIVVA